MIFNSKFKIQIMRPANQSWVNFHNAVQRPNFLRENSLQRIAESCKASQALPRAYKRLGWIQKAANGEHVFVGPKKLTPAKLNKLRQHTHPKNEAALNVIQPVFQFDDPAPAELQIAHIIKAKVRERLAQESGVMTFLEVMDSLFRCYAAKQPYNMTEQPPIKQLLNIDNMDTITLPQMYAIAKDQWVEVHYPQRLKQFIDDQLNHSNQ
jgi:hypothetical protein